MLDHSREINYYFPHGTVLRAAQKLKVGSSPLRNHSEEVIISWTWLVFIWRLLRCIHRPVRSEHRNNSLGSLMSCLFSDSGPWPGSRVPRSSDVRGRVVLGNGISCHYLPLQLTRRGARCLHTADRRRRRLTYRTTHATNFNFITITTMYKHRANKQLYISLWKYIVAYSILSQSYTGKKIFNRHMNSF